MCKNKFFQSSRTKNEFFKVLGREMNFSKFRTKNEFYAKFRNENNTFTLNLITRVRDKNSQITPETCTLGI